MSLVFGGTDFLLPSGNKMGGYDVLWTMFKLEQCDHWAMFGALVAFVLAFRVLVIAVEHMNCKYGGILTLISHFLMDKRQKYNEKVYAA